jgi:ectoine hydroxylase-related dioxygenase (phytanoyl-CoA dioxygenase family)
VSLIADHDVAGFARDGFVVVRGAVAEGLLSAADEEIDGLVGQTPPDQGDGGPGANLWFPPRERLPACEAALRQSAALSAAEELVAPLRLEHAFDHIQVATTVPPWSHIPGGPHIDGHAKGQDPPGSFTLLAGILLTDQQAGSSGNLWVWPGSHQVHAQLFRERGTRALLPSGGHATLLDPPAVLGPRVELTGQRGDLVLAHYLLGHNGGGNTGPRPRRTIYHRLAAAGHRQRWEQTFLDPWTEYAPVRRAVSRPAG